MTCSGASHSIMHGDITYHGCECMVAIKHLTWCLVGRLGTVGQSPIESHGCMKRKENLSRGNNKKSLILP